MLFRKIVRVGVYSAVAVLFQAMGLAQPTGAGQALSFDGVNDQVTVTGFGNSAPTLAYFQYGPTTGYGSTVNVTNLLNRVGVVAVSNSITGLTPGAGYHFRLVATNSSGLVLGGDQSFTIPSLPAFTGQVVLGDGNFKLRSPA